MSILPTSAISLDEDGRVRINRAGSAVKHAQFNVGATQVELTAGLANRRTLIIKPVRVGGSLKRFIMIGPSGFTTADGTPVWEEYELALQIDPNIEVFAKKGDSQDGNVDVRILEVGDA
jgi:hypothetical protein